ncbi:unnamed protein product [Mytilus edulis]|uniref:Uncharacterized protein n=1 Tax=Mytilus edulis TaxID=6550 RepID=A0A8S3QGY9_MYTED|nr:unnamed protein product [Mytilus edulis]
MEPATHDLSVALYRYMCQNIVGTEEQVRTLRMMNTVRDNLQSNEGWTMITSGSLGEGLQIRGSDLDIMMVFTFVEVCENPNIHFYPCTTYFTMEQEDTSPGFTKLRLVYKSATHDTSVDLYRFMCQHIVGTEEQVKTVRMMNSVRDNLRSNNDWTVITSGSFGDGLQMRGSDLDIMMAIKCIEVCEDTNIPFNPDAIYLAIETEDTQPESAKQNPSMVMYDYLCQNIVGTEVHVKTIRMTNAVRDNLQSDNITTVINSGSFGDGLEMQGSDVDPWRCQFIFDS